MVERLIDIEKVARNERQSKMVRLNKCIQAIFLIDELYLSGQLLREIAQIVVEVANIDSSDVSQAFDKMDADLSSTFYRYGGMALTLPKLLLG